MILDSQCKKSPSDALSAIIVLALALALPLMLSAQEKDSSATKEQLLSPKEITQIREMFKNDPNTAEKEIKRLQRHRQRARQLKRSPENLRSELMTIVARLRKNNRQDMNEEFISAHGELSNLLSWLVNKKVPIPRDIGNDMAGELIQIYEVRRAFRQDLDRLAIEVSARYGDSPKVKKYLTAILNGPKGKRRNFAITELAWTKSLKGDSTIYRVLESLFAREGNEDSLILAVMSRIDREQTLPLLIQEIAKAKDVAKLNKYSDILSEYGRPELLKHVLRRVKDFPRANPAADNNATLGIYPKLLLQYIREAEGEELKIALFALEQTAMALGGSYSILISKLKSPNPVSRKAVLSSLLNIFSTGNFIEEKTLQDLTQYADREVNPNLKKDAEKAISLLKNKLSQH